MSKYHFRDIEKKWQKFWAENKTFKADNYSQKPKFYALDMFPYPSGAGLHVGHPLGYIASDIYSRYKRHQGFNVLHPMGYDSFGLPAEQYAIQTGQHPAKTTEENIERYREQMDKIGFSFDWDREVRTSNPEYYRWTQWIFLQILESWYDKDADKARPISDLIAIFSSEGNSTINAACDEDVPEFTAEEWKNFSTTEKEEILLQYRLTYLAETEVNWCPQLGTVLANDEIVNGVSERGGFPVVRKKMKQWSMRITAYAQRLLDDLQKIDWPEPLKDSQTYWIGRSEGAMVDFKVKDFDASISVFTTRPDTIFGVSFMVLAPEHDLVEKITTSEHKSEVEEYIAATAKRSERDRMADVKTITGVFTGTYAEHPFTKEPIPIWIGDYVLAGYGTGAVMSVPAGDERDYAFAKHFNIPIPNIFENVNISEESYSNKEQVVFTNSDFLNGLNHKEALKKALDKLEAEKIGFRQINYRLRDAVFSRQRYWGEPFPIYYKNGMPQSIPEKCLPLELPEVEKYLPTETGEPPLGRADVWAWDIEKEEVVSNDLINHKTIFPLELNTMPGWAGSSWYFFRYMEDDQRDDVFASEEALNYWKNVDLYIGGSEHATGHLLYSRFWVKFLHDRGLSPVDEPFKKLINQGMILGESAFVHRLNIDFTLKLKIKQTAKEFLQNTYKSFGIEGNKQGTLATPYYFSKSFKENKALFHKYFHNNLKNEIINNLLKTKKILDEIPPMYLFEGIDITNYYLTPIHTDVSMVDVHNHLDVEAFKNWREEYKKAEFITEEDGSFSVSREVEKMSKSKYNVVNPDDICDEYGADTLRMYEMFLGPLEQSKPWNTAGITGVHGFLKKLWKLFHSGENDSFFLSDEAPSKEGLKTLHKTIQKVEEDIENFSFNTSVSTFMIAVNELSSQKCYSKEILESLLILISPYAPHIAEELWQKSGHSDSISKVPFPKFDKKHLVESTKEYPISFNGKMRFTMELPMDLTKEEIESAVMSHEKTIHYLEGRTPKRVIIVPGKIVNIVG